METRGLATLQIRDQVSILVKAHMVTVEEEEQVVAGGISDAVEEYCRIFVAYFVRLYVEEIFGILDSTSNRQGLAGLIFRLLFLFSLLPREIVLLPSPLGPFAYIA
jgi:hypothetical protein